jgi:hypothetical protein
MWEKDQRSSGEYSKVIHYFVSLAFFISKTERTVYRGNISGDDKRYEM